ncbi:hypothetical protein [Mucilaginibacter sp. 44-25]|uniref:hypothetical protein n=1 Tax=Mucilaginibacter sp. 44-25 TaxID=1895794 RepID=UPI0009650553|nr:hypothetical protein [Mucilaginibacter sp. 44-25]OJW12500.1 MAG: hypothetical protein BGO48_05240 [Mucilaginibacter sp. 44-25]
MSNSEIKIPAFVQDYLTKLDGDGFKDFAKIAGDYQKEREEYPGKFAQQSAHLNNHNRITGQNKKLDYEQGLKGIDEKYQQKAYQVAKQHGYTGPNPNAPSDKDFTRQGQKFKSMIDQARKAQRESDHPSPDKPQGTKSQEKKSPEQQKGQQSYNQTKANVNFKGVQQGQAASVEEKNREQQRAAFLEKTKQAREQNSQQRNTERER